MPRSDRQSGFTLMEIMIVMALIATLAGVGLSMYGNSVTRAKEATLKEDLFRMRDAIDQYYADKNKYPPTLEALVADKYLRAIPVDPFTSRMILPGALRPIGMRRTDKKSRRGCGNLNLPTPYPSPRAGRGGRVRRRCAR